MALPIPRLVGVKVVELLLAAPRQRSGVTVMRIIAIVDVTIEAAVAAIPGAGSNENTAIKPIGPIVTIGRTVIRRIIKVTVRAPRRWPDIDRNLGRCCGCAA